MQLPQCPICLTLLTEDLELVRPEACGHVMCRNCARLLSKDNPKCPFCSASARLKDFRQVVLSYGECDPYLPTAQEIEADSPSSDDLPVEEEPTTAGRRSLVKRGEQTLRLLDDIANSDPRDWRFPSVGSGLDKGLAFAQTGRLISDVGNIALDDNVAMKTMMKKIGESVANLQKCYRKVVDVAESYRSSEGKNASLRDAMAEKDIMQMHAMQAKERELKNREKEFKRREAELKDKMVRMQKALDNARLEQTMAVEAMEEMDKERQKALRRIKKLKTVARQASSSHADASDSSLEILEEEELPTPCSSLTLTDSQLQAEKEELSSRHPKSSSSHSNSRPKSKTKSRVSSSSTPLQDSSVINLVSSDPIMPEPDLGPGEPHEHEHEQEHKQKSGLSEFTDALLKTELQQRRKPESKKSSVVITSRPRPPVSADSASRRTVPSTNPFSAMMRERKKPRLHVQTGS